MALLAIHMAATTNANHSYHQEMTTWGFKNINKKKDFQTQALREGNMQFNHQTAIYLLHASYIFLM